MQYFDLLFPVALQFRLPFFASRGAATNPGSLCGRLARRIASINRIWSS